MALDEALADHRQFYALVSPSEAVSGVSALGHYGLQHLDAGDEATAREFMGAIDFIQEQGGVTMPAIPAGFELWALSLRDAFAHVSQHTHSSRYFLAPADSTAEQAAAFDRAQPMPKVKHPGTQVELIARSEMSSAA